MKLRELLAEKEELLSQKESHIKNLQVEIEELSKRLAEKEASEKHFASIFKGYEKILTKIINEHQDLKQENQALESNFTSIDSAFTELLSKYEQAKTVIRGLMANEAILKNQLHNCETIIASVGERYSNLQEHATQKLNKASAMLEKTDKKHIAETAKLKATILQSKVRINDLEKHISHCNIKDSGDRALNTTSRLSMFEPLKNHFIH